MEREELVEKFSGFLNEDCLDDLVTALTENRKSISIDFSLLDKFDVELGDYLLENPEDAFSAAEEAIKSIDTGMAENKLRVRFYGLPESRNNRIRKIRAEHLGKLIVVDGVVKSASEIRPEISEAVFACPECGMRMSVLQADRAIKAPDRCECGCKRGFSLVDQKMFDVRWVTVEEPFEITSGEQPSELTILMKEDLTTPLMQNRTEPGNRILITGVLKSTPRSSKDASTRMMDIYLDANQVESIEVGWEELNISNEDEQKIIELSKDPLLYEKLVASLAPTIYGLNDVKEAIILQMFAGEQHVLRDKTRIRGNLHLLLVGDPACLVADERIVLADGTIMKMGDAGTRHMQDIDLRVHTGSGRNYGRADRFHLYRRQPVMEVITETGKSIKGSYNQPLLVLEDMKNVWKRLDEMRIGDNVRTLSKIECRIKSPVATGWSDKDYYHKKQEWKIKVPAAVDEELASIFGYVIADGWVQKNRVGFVVSDDEADILPYLERAFAGCFGAPVSTYVHKRASSRIAYYQVNRTHAAGLLQFLKEKRVPDSIFKSGDRVVASFLRWLYEGDGTVFANGRGRTSVSLRSASIELLRDVQMLLLRFGIQSRILWDGKSRTSTIGGRVVKGNPSGTLMIRRSESITKFAKSIGFVSAKKKARMGKAAEYARTHARRVHQERAEKIVQIRYHAPEDVFDIEVPVHHRFVANGIVVHNTAKSQIMKLASTMIPRGKYASGTAVSGAGLCTVYDTLVQQGDGTITKIGNMVEGEFAKRTDGIRQLDDGIYFVDAPARGGNGSRTLIAFDDGSLKLKPSAVTRYWKIRAPDKLVKITTRTGKSVYVTQENPVPTIKEGRIIWKRAADILPGEHLATPRVLDVDCGNESLSGLMPGNAWLSNECFDIGLFKKLILSRGSIRSFCRKTGLDEDDIYYNWKSTGGHGAPKVSELRSGCESLGMGVENLLSERVTLSQFHGHRTALPVFMNAGLAYMMGLISGDGSISRTCMGGSDIRFFNIHDGLLDAYRKLCVSQLGIGASDETDGYGLPCIRFRSKIFGGVLDGFGIVGGDKAHGLYISERTSRLPKPLLSSYLRGCFDTDGCVVRRKTRGSSHVELSSVSEAFIKGVQMLLLRYGITSIVKEKPPRTSVIRGRTVRSGTRYDLVISNLDNLKAFRSGIGFGCVEKSDKLDYIIGRISKAHNNMDLVPEIGCVLRRCRESLGLRPGEFYRYGSYAYAYETGMRKPSRRMLADVIGRLGDGPGRCGLHELSKFAESDLFWDGVKKVEVVENKEHEYVYDVTVEGEHSFVANGLIIHNTATVVREEKFVGGWVLEAGALVLANRSICAIDEFSHVAPHDMIKLQEAMSLETISIAKASIVATLPAQTAILAGANPKFGRFDPYIPIKEQLDINEVMLSRFDLRFALKDVPNPELDLKIADHVLKMRHFEEDAAAPVIDPAFLRKYIAYARANVHPKLTVETGEKLKEFYLEMRAMSGEDSAVSITVRQYDSLIRISEASAKVRLSETVDIEDAQRAINLMSLSLRQFGFEPSTGKIDIDRVEGQRMTSAQRGKTKVMMDVIAAIESDTGKEMPRDELVRRAAAEGIDDAEAMVRTLLQMGELYEPRPGFVSRVRS